MALGLKLNLQACAGISQLIEKQKASFEEVRKLIQDHSGRLNSDMLAAKLASATNVALADIKQNFEESIKNFEESIKKKEERILQEVEDVNQGVVKVNLGVHEILKILNSTSFLDDWQRRQGEYILPSENIQDCLVMAPFDRFEWQAVRKGRHVI
jgi:gas vesicle protein